MDRLAFKSTTKSSSDDMLARLEALGGNIQCVSSREAIMYQGATFNKSVEDAVAILAETIRYPLITDEELAQQLHMAEYEIGQIWSKSELILPELIHVAAFHDNTLGNPLLCPRERLGMITRDTLETYRRRFYTPDRMVIAFAGLPHSTAVSLAEKYFGDMPPAPAFLVAQPESPSTSSHSDASETPSQASSTNPSSALFSPPPSPPPSGVAAGPFKRLLSKIPGFKHITTSATNSADVILVDPTPAMDTAAHYTGGFFSLAPQPPSNPNQPAFSHIHLAFEGIPIGSDDLYALATLQTLLGGGGSFSAGGPGKGMFSRLYTQVLNRYAWCESCIAFNHSYTDSGLFGISASCQPQNILHMLQIMCEQLHSLTPASGHRALTRDEVSRAKNLLRSNLLMNLESRMIGLEDLGRQVQIYGERLPTRYMCERIEALTPEDLARVATMVVRGEVRNPGAGSGSPTVVLQEALVPGMQPLQWNDLQERIASSGLGRSSPRT